MIRRGLLQLLLACALCAAFAGCGVRQTHIAQAPATAPLRTSTQADLAAKYDQLAQSISTLNAAVTMQWTSSSTFTGIIKQYPRVSGFILAQKPDLVRVIGQAPVIGTNIFDMVSDGRAFSVYIPSKNQFLTGPATLGPPSEKAVENLRPQHLLQTLFWQPVPSIDAILFEQATDNGTPSYVLTIAAQAGSSAVATTPATWRLIRKIWFERVGLTMSRIQIYGDQGEIDSDIRYSQWQPFGAAEYPRQITLVRPAEGYTLAITVTKLTANASIESTRFVLKQPPNSQLIHVGDEPGSAPQ